MPTPSDLLTVGELIEALSQFDKALPVSITDGYRGQVYLRLKQASISVFTELDATHWCDIGIGGCEPQEQEDE